MSELVLASIDQVKDFAKSAIQSKLLPPGVDTPEKAFVIIVTGQELGLSPMQSLRGIHVIQGRPVLSAQLIVALAKRSNFCEYFKLVESTAEKATYETRRAGDPSPTTLSYTIEEAKRAGLVGKDVWRNHPASMLRARCAAALARDVYPDVLLGVYEEDEGREIAGEYSSVPVIVQGDSSSGYPPGGLDGRRYSVLPPTIEATPPALTPDPLVADYKRRIAEAKDSQELNAIALSLKKDLEAKKIPAEARPELQSFYKKRSDELKPFMQQALEELGKASNAPHVDQIEAGWLEHLKEEEWPRWKQACADRRKQLGGGK